MKSKIEGPLLMYRSVIKIKSLPLLPTANELLAEFTHILTIFSSYILACRCFCICSSWTKFPTELLFLKTNFLKRMATLKFL